VTWWYDYESRGPIDVEGGIRARSARGEIGKSWWAQRWSQALNRLMDSGRLSRGRSYARRGQVISIDETEGTVVAKVQGSRPRPYRVRIELARLPDEVWERVLDQLADQALFAAQLLAGEMPADIEEAFAAAGASLFPARNHELITDCSCPDWANPCKHVAAVYFLLGEAFDDDPFMIFRLRGRSQDQVLAALRARRKEQPGGEAGLALLDSPRPPVMPAPLPEQPATFWGWGEPLDDLVFNPRHPGIELGILQRLGQPEFVPQDIVSLLGTTYEHVSRQAEALAYAEEEPEEENAG
jgi:uncharacterized Zn finger protein